MDRGPRALVDRACDQPEAGGAGDLAEPVGERPGQLDGDRLRVAVGLVERPGDGGEVELREYEELGVRHGGLHGGRAVGEDLQRGLRVARDRRRLHRGDRERCHSGLSLMTCMSPG